MKILKLEIKDFRNIKHAVFETKSGESFSIRGANNSGKTSVQNAFLWLMTGKDAEGNESANIKPIDRQTREIVRGTMPEVTGTFLLEDGSTVTLCKQLCEKLGRVPGSTEKAYKGDETKCMIDGIPKSVTEYAAFIESLCPFKALRTLVDVYYFNEKATWQERRAALCAMYSDGITPQDVAAKNPELQDLVSSLGRHSPEEFQTACKAQAKQAKQASDNAAVRLDEAQRQIPATCPDDEAVADAQKKIAQIRVEQGQLNHRLLEIQNTDESASILSQVAQVKESLRTLASKRSSFESIFSAQWRGEHAERVSKASSELRTATMELKEAETTVSILQDSIQKTQAQLDQYRAAWRNENEREYDGNTVCPTCGQEIPAEQVKAAQAAFNVAKANALEELSRKGKAAANKVQELSESLKVALATVTTKQSIVQAAQQKYNEVNAETPPAPPAETVQAMDKEHNDLQAKLSTLEEELQNVQAGASKQQEVQEIESKLQALREEEAALLQVSREKQFFDEVKARVIKLQEDARNARMQYEEKIRLSHLCDLYISERAKMLVERINCNFTDVQFQLFKQAKNGTVSDDCEPYVHGIPYSPVNHTGKLLAGMDVVKAFSRYYEITMPLFVDDRELVTDVPDMIDTQVINIYVDPAINTPTQF